MVDQSDLCCHSIHSNGMALFLFILDVTDDHVTLYYVFVLFIYYFFMDWLDLCSHIIISLSFDLDHHRFNHS